MRVIVLFGSVVLYGAERGNLEALTVLKREGAEILFLISDDPWNSIVPPALDQRGFAWRKTGYVHMGRGLSWYNLLWGNPRRFIQANRALARAIRQFRPTHIHAYAQSHVANFCWALMRTGTPLVFRAGDEATLHNRLWRTIWKFTVWRTQRFVANSEFVARSLRQSGVSAQKITVIYNTPPVRPSVPRPLPELNLPARGRVFAYIGQIAEHKGPHILIDAFRELGADFPQACLVLAGRISDWQGDAWGRALRDSTKADPVVGGRITFLGEVDDVDSVLACCEALIVPSLFDDPSPNVVMEAKRAGKAVIAFPRGGLPELIEHQVDGLLCRETSRSALVEALKIYLEEPSIPRRHGRHSRESLSRLQIGEFSRRWLFVYNSVGTSAQAR